MGKKSRKTAPNRDQSDRSGPSHLDPSELFERLQSGTEADARLLYAHDAAAEPLRPLLSSGNIETPIALIEPIRAFIVKHEGGTYDMGLAVAKKMGLPVAEPSEASLAQGWMFGPRNGQWDLVDPTGTLIARCAVRGEDSVAEPAWTAQAIAAEKVLIVYGTRIGVRVPDGVPPNKYDDEWREAELLKSLTSQKVCAATVRLSQTVRAFGPSKMASRRA